MNLPEEGAPVSFGAGAAVSCSWAPRSNGITPAAPLTLGEVHLHRAICLVDELLRESGVVKERRDGYADGARSGARRSEVATPRRMRTAPSRRR